MVCFSRDHKSCFGIGLATPIHCSGPPPGSLQRVQQAGWFRSDCCHLLVAGFGVASPCPLHTQTLPRACGQASLRDAVGSRDATTQPFTPPNFSLASSCFVRALGWTELLSAEFLGKFCFEFPAGSSSFLRDRPAPVSSSNSPPGWRPRKHISEEGTDSRSLSPSVSSSAWSCPSHLSLSLPAS